MMRILTAMSLCAVMAASAWATAPSAVFLGDGPGINAPFLNDGSVDTYGQITHVGGFNWDGTGGATDNWGFFRYRPSLAGDPGTHVDMPSDQDWVFEISFMQEGGIGTEGPFYLKDNDLDKRMLGVTNHQDGTYSLTAANADNSMRVVAGPLALAEGEWGDFVYHYKSATGLVDAYFNGALVAGDFEIETMAGDGAMADFAQGEWQRVGTTWFRNIQLGQIPEPATMVLLTLGACVALRGRRR